MHGSNSAAPSLATRTRTPANGTITPPSFVFLGELQDDDTFAFVTTDNSPELAINVFGDVTGVQIQDPNNNNGGVAINLVQGADVNGNEIWEIPASGTLPVGIYTVQITGTDIAGDAAQVIRDLEIVATGLAFGFGGVAFGFGTVAFGFRS